MGRRVLGILVSVTLLTASPAFADDGPGASFKAAVDKTARAKTATISVSQRTSRQGRTEELSATGVLSGGDSDLVVDGETGKGRRVAVGTTVKQRTPDRTDTAWRTVTRAQPAQTTALGDLKLADGTSIGDPKLYRSIADGGTEQVPQGQARKLVGELNMAAVAQAMRLGDADRARLARMNGTLTLWIGPDGTVARNTIALSIPGATGPTTIEATVDLSELDEPIAITLP